MPTVVFKPSSDGGIPEPTLSDVKRLVELVLSDIRRPEEVWVIVHHEPPDRSDWEFEVSNGQKTETLLLESKEADANSEFYAMFRQFIRENWP